jgi:hypothetical protein
MLERSRGFLEGYTQGFYNDNRYTLSDECLGEDTIQLVKRIAMSVSDYSNENLFQIAIATLKLRDELYDECEVERYLQEPTAFCFTHECDSLTLIANMSVNKYHIMAEASKINTKIFEEKENESYFSYWKDVGKSTGIIVRKTLGYRPGGRRFV